jgi:hypothetical protein
MARTYSGRSLAQSITLGRLEHHWGKVQIQANSDHWLGPKQSEVTVNIPI